MKYIDNKSISSNNKINLLFLKDLSNRLKKMHSVTFDKIGNSRYEDDIFDRIIKQRLPLIKEYITLQEYLMLEQNLIRIHDIMNKINIKKVFCHRDLTYNILFDGKESPLVDLESAAIDSPYYDIANILVFFAYENENYFLNNYYGISLNQKEKDILYLMKQVVLAYSVIRGFRNVELKVL